MHAIKRNLIFPRHISIRLHVFIGNIKLYIGKQEFFLCFLDFIMCIKPDSVEVYCNPLNYDFILPYIAGWPDVKIHCLTYQEVNTVILYQDNCPKFLYTITMLVPGFLLHMRNDAMSSSNTKNT